MILNFSWMTQKNIFCAQAKYKRLDCNPAFYDLIQAMIYTYLDFPKATIDLDTFPRQG